MKKVTITAFAIMFLVACKKDANELEPDAGMQSESVSKANTEKEKVTRPMKVVLYSSVNSSSPSLTCSLPGVPFGLANSGYFLHGNATHLGVINSETSIGLDGSCNVSGTTFILTTTTAGKIVGANGDWITYTGNDQIDLNNIIFHGGTTAAFTGLWTITGGTGIFAGATGSFQVTGFGDVSTPGGPTFSITGEGTITY